jgi:hypothetical protein
MRTYLRTVAVGVAASGIATMLTAPAGAVGSVRSAVSLAGPAYGVYGSRAQLTGTLWRHGTGTRIAGATVVLQRAAHGSGKWGGVTSTRTSSTGTFAFMVTLGRVYDYRAVYAGSPAYTTAVSGLQSPRILQKVILDSVRTTNSSVEGGNLGTLQATGRVYPAPPAGTRVWLQRYDAGARTWRNYMSTWARGGTSTITITGDVPGTVGTFRLQSPLYYPYYPGTSNAIGHQHFVWRGVFTKPVLATGGTPGAGRYLLQPHEDELRFRINLWAERGGTSWVEVNTSGCLQLDASTWNVTDQIEPGQQTTIEAAVFHGATRLAAQILQPGAETGQVVSARGIARIRLQARALQDGPPTSAWAIAALCNN